MQHTWKDEGIYPEALGSYHMYHRIDGKLVAVGVIDISNRYLKTGYFIYDPDYKFLNLGVIGAIRELEYMQLIIRDHNPSMTFYQLGTMVPHCPKVNYKLKYQPGTVICPRTKVDLYWNDIKHKAAIFEGLSIYEKSKLPYLQLEETEMMLENNLNSLTDEEVYNTQIFYGPDATFIKLGQLSLQARKVL